MTRPDSVTRDIYVHAESAFPQECCGIVSAAGEVVPLNNIAEDPFNSFKISPIDYLKFSGGSLFVYHSHPDRLAVASEADLAASKRMNKPLMIVSWPQGDIRMIGNPCYGKPLEGRRFIYGVYDCYSLVQDFYMREYQIQLPTITRPRFGWWDSGEVDPFTEGAACSAMEDVSSPEDGDVLLFKFPGYKVVNHIGIYREGNKVLHHAVLQVSTVSPYDQQYRDATTRILRRAS